jgi:LacI family transcriptional regulator
MQPDDLQPEGRLEQRGVETGRVDRPLKPTLRTLAALTGFAITTVSRALANDPRIAQSTRDAVARAAAEIGYIPDRAAQRLRTGRTQVISLVLDPHSEILGFSGSMIAGIAEGLRGTRYHISITQYALEEDPMRPILHIVRNQLADGIIFARTRPQDERVKFLLSHDFPFVTHGRTEIATQHPWFDYDNDRFAYLAVRHLAARGRKRICIIPPSQTYTFARYLIEGFRRAIRDTDTGFEIPDEVDLNDPPDRVNRYFARRLTEPDAPDAIICPGEIAAIAINAAIADAGLTLGREVDLVAKQTSLVFDLFRPRMDAIYEDIHQAGDEMARLLLRRIAGEPAEGLQKLQAPVPRF